MQVSEADIEPHLQRVKTEALQHALRCGVGFLHETMAQAEKDVVLQLFGIGAIQVRIPPPQTQPFRSLFYSSALE